MSSKNIVLSVADWDTSAIKYMAPKVNDKGGKSINVLSKQTNRSLHITTPLMMTWGISDFIDDKGESDGKYQISLNFPNDEYRNATSDQFLEKLKAFETQILNDAVKNSELWWGESMSLELVKHTFFPFIKYSKNKDTKKFDYTRPPSIRAKVPNYNGKWGVEIYNTNSELIFPCEDEHMTPMDFVPKLSQVACGLQCTGIWIGGKGWGLTWKMFQCIVKPREVVSAYGKCHVTLSAEEKQTMDKQVILDDVTAEELVEKEMLPPPTQVEDSDAEDDIPDPVASMASATPAPTAAPTTVFTAATATAEDPNAAKKKVVRKKAVA